MKGWKDLTVLHCIFSGVVTPPPAALVRPGTVHTYVWRVPVGAGPVRGDPDCLTYLYYSGVDPVRDTSSGLVGPLLVCRQRALARGEQVGQDLQGPMFSELPTLCWTFLVSGRVQNSRKHCSL